MQNHSLTPGAISRTALAVTLALGMGTAGVAAANFTLQQSSRASEWTIALGNRPVMVYAFDPQKNKPYVKALYTTKGFNVLRDSPSDHLHHHGLMYGIKVNGVNFWEETRGCGVEKVVSWTAPEFGSDSAGRPQAQFSQVLHWLAPEDAFLPDAKAPSLLIEQRRLILTVDERLELVALRWDAHFQVGSRSNEVALTGANYHGLGARFPEELDKLVVHLIPEGKLPLEGSHQDVTARAWEAASFDAPDHPVTFALFSAPQNARGQSRYFAMKSAFPYLAATQGLDKEPLVYQRGDEFDLSYTVVVYTGVRPSEFLSAQAQEWVKH